MSERLGVRSTRVAVAIAGSVMLAACSTSPPVRYYTLSDVAPTAGAGGGGSETPVSVDRVTIPSELDRLQLVRRLSVNQLDISDMDRWAAPLDDMVRRVLWTDLSARLSPGLVLDPNVNGSHDPPPRSLSIDIIDFYGDASCGVTLRASWLVKRGHNEGPQRMQDIHVAPAGACPAALPQAMSQALAQLTDLIAADLIAADLKRPQS